MAEFQEVMHQYDRMCSHYEECEGCPFHKKVVWCIKKIGGKRYVNGNAKPAEELIMQWAAEHPEPVYPTWLEWLEDMGIVFYKPFSETEARTTIFVPEAVKPIPSDIAEKLGLEPVNK